MDGLSALWFVLRGRLGLRHIVAEDLLGGTDLEHRTPLAAYGQRDRTNGHGPSFLDVLGVPN